jgi:hypothetical protein
MPRNRGVRERAGRSWAQVQTGDADAPDFVDMHTVTVTEVRP